MEVTAKPETALIIAYLVAFSCNCGFLITAINDRNVGINKRNAINKKLNLSEFQPINARIRK